MSSVKIPCPACAAALTLDEITAGTRVACPDCRAEVSMPGIVDASLFPTLVHDGQPEVPAARLPLRRDRGRERGTPVDDADWESRAAPADSRPAGPALPDPAEKPDPSRVRVKLPERRSMEATPATGAHAASDPVGGGAGSDWADGPAAAAAGSRPAGPQSPVREIRPIPAKPDQVMQPAALPVRAPAPARRPVPASAPESRPAAAAAPVPENAEPALAKGGHRLGEDRQLHFTPFLAGTGDVESTQWSGESQAPAKSKKLVIFAAAFVLLLGASYGAYVMKYGDLAAPSAGEETEAERLKKNQPNPLQNLEAARVVLRRFFSASNPEDMLKEVRHPEITAPRLKQWLAGKPLKPRTIENESQAWNEIRIGEAEFITGALSMDDFRVANVALEIQKDGQVKVDWESYANWAEVSWPDFLKNQPERPVDYRVVVMPIRYYNYAFQGKEAEMLAFRLEDPEKFGYCYAYCHKDSAAAARLIDHLRKARRLGRVTKEGVPVIQCMLRLHFPEEGKKGNQALIDDFISESWILP